MFNKERQENLLGMESIEDAVDNGAGVVTATEVVGGDGEVNPTLEASRVLKVEIIEEELKRGAIVVDDQDSRITLLLEGEFSDTVGSVGGKFCV